MMKLLAVAVILLASAGITFGQAAGGGVPGPTTGGTVTGVTATSPVTSSGGAAPVIACATCGVTSSPLNQFATTTSAQLASILSDETGTGSVVFSASPALTGNPTAPTQTIGDNTTKIATDAFVLANAGGPPTGAASNCLTGTYPGPGLNATCVVAGVAGQAINPSSVTSTGTCPFTGSGSGLGCWIGTTSATLPSAGNSGFDGIVAGTTALYAVIGVAAPTPLITQASLQVPQISILTSASGTYTTPTGAVYLKVTAQGCGGAGAGSGTGASDGGNCSSGNTTFGASIAAGFGGGGSAFYSYGGTGGTATGGNDNRAGNPGGSAIVALATAPGGNGAGGCSGGGGHGGWAQGGFFTGGNATSPGGGGGGAAATGVANAGGGGGAGGCVYALITSPASTYAYAIGGGSTGGGAGTSGSAGGNGAAGQIIVEAYFQ